MVVLTNNTLSKYFSLPNRNTTALLLDKNPYDFISRDSDTLVVTIGDSWTWGADLTQINNVKLHIDRLEDDAYRLENVYGGILAERLSADFLNLGESGAGNWHIVRKITELSNISHELNYKNIIVISIFTDLGRDFNSLDDVDIDYRSWLINNITDSKSYYGFLKFINQQISKKILQSVSGLDKKCKLYFGTNFVDPLGYDELQDYFLDHTWLEVICEKNNINYRPEHCYMVFPWVIKKFNSLFDFAPELDRTVWLEWINEITDRANVRAEVCSRDSIIFNQLLHPTAGGHKQFAEYLMSQL
jgi:hypothetical protein